MTFQSPKWLTWLYLVLLLLVGIFYHLPFVDIHSILSPGDHGLNLYNAERVLKGDKPYIDFHWFYGPAMLYYFAGIMMFLGITIKSMLWGVTLLKILCGFVVFSSFRLFTAPLLSTIATLWYWSFNIDFFYTYNHIGGILLNLLIFYTILRFLKTRNISSLYWGLGFIFALSFIKLNFGFVMLLAYVISTLLIHFIHPVKSKLNLQRFLIWALIGIPAGVLAGHLFFVQGLPLANIKQCFPLLGDDNYMQRNHNVLTNTFVYIKYLFNTIKASAPNLIFTGILIIFLGNGIHKNVLKPNNETDKKIFILFWAIWIIFYIAALHEFILSAIPFRSIWAKPFELLFIFFAFSFGLKNIHKTISFCIFLVLLTLPLLSMNQSHQSLAQFRKPAHYLFHHRGGLYVKNSPTMIKTVLQTDYYINNSIPKHEKLFIMPYDPLYYFLANRKSPTRQLIYFEFINIHRDEQLKIIADLENNNTKWILQSNRINSPELGMGYFGKTYGKTLHTYIEGNFTEIVRFGDWRQLGGWGWSYATRILKRNDTL